MKTDRILGICIIIAGIVNFWDNVPYWVASLFIIFAGLLYLTMTSRRVHVDPPRRNKEIGRH
jgi:hypothetical protein